MNPTKSNIEKINGKILWNAINDNDIELAIEIALGENCDCDFFYSGFSCIHIASMFHGEEWHELASILIQKGADILRISDEGSYAYHYAAQSGNLGIMKSMEKSGFNPLKLDTRESNALSYAAFGGSFEVFSYLITIGVNPSNKGVNGWTVWHAAAHNGNMEIIEKLYEVNKNIS